MADASRRQVGEVSIGFPVQEGAPTPLGREGLAVREVADEAADHLALLGVGDREGVERDPGEGVVSPVDRVEEDRTGLAPDLDAAALLGDQGPAEAILAQERNHGILGHLVEPLRLGLRRSDADELGPLRRVHERQGDLLDRGRDLVACLRELHLFLRKMPPYRPRIRPNGPADRPRVLSDLSEVFM